MTAIDHGQAHPVCDGGHSFSRNIIIWKKSGAPAIRLRRFRGRRAIALGHLGGRDRKGTEKGSDPFNPWKRGLTPLIPVIASRRRSNPPAFARRLATAWQESHTARPSFAALDCHGASRLIGTCIFRRNDDGDGLQPQYQLWRTFIAATWGITSRISNWVCSTISPASAATGRRMNLCAPAAMNSRSRARISSAPPTA